jgi:ribonuclease-3
MSLIEEFQSILQYQFKNIDLLTEALTHPSFSGQRPNVKNYQRLEFLGDAVLGLAVTSLLNNIYPLDREGELAKKRAHLICTTNLSFLARSLNFGKYMILSYSEEVAGGRENSNNLENVFEAVIGAIFLDSNYEIAYEFVDRNIRHLVDKLIDAPKDAKSAVQEWAQKRQIPLPKYIVEEREGPDHNPIFKVKLIVQGEEEIIGVGKNKKEAEHAAANQFLEYLNERK